MSASSRACSATLHGNASSTLRSRLPASEVARPQRHRASAGSLGSVFAQVRRASRIFKEACKYIFRLDLSTLSIEWSGVNIVQNLFPIFGHPLTLVGMRAARSIKMRQMKQLAQSKLIRIESLSAAWQLHGTRSRLKKLGDLVSCSQVAEVELGGCASLRSAGASVLVNSLSTATSLQKLGLRACQIGAEGALVVSGLAAGRACTVNAANDHPTALPPALVSPQQLNALDMHQPAEENGVLDAVAGDEGGLALAGAGAVAGDLQGQVAGDEAAMPLVALPLVHADSQSFQAQSNEEIVAAHVAMPEHAQQELAVEAGEHEMQQEQGGAAHTRPALGAASRHLSSPLPHQRSFCALSMLDLQDNGIGAEGATLFSVSLTQAGETCRLRSLNLSLNNLRSEGAAAVSKMLLSNTTITHLNLSWNLIRSPGGKALASVLRSNSTLCQLDLGFNLLRCNGTSMLAAALSASRSLLVLSLRRNELGPEGASQLAGALQENKCLHTLNLGLNGISPLGAAKMAQALAQNSTLTHLDLDWNAIRQLGLLLLTNGLRDKCGLVFLDLSHNKLMHQGTGALASALTALASARLRSSRPSSSTLSLDYSASEWDASKEEGREWACDRRACDRRACDRRACDRSGQGGTCLDRAADQAQAAWPAQASTQSLPLVLIKGNKLGAEGLAGILPGLRADDMGGLDLSDNDLRDQGCRVLAEQGAHLLPWLRCLNVSGNGITSLGLDCLARALAGSTMLQELKISRNQVEVRTESVPLACAACSCVLRL